MEKKILALELGSFLVRLNLSVLVSCFNTVDVSIRLDSTDVSKLQQILNSIQEAYCFNYEFVDCSDLEAETCVCHCYFK